MAQRPVDFYREYHSHPTNKLIHAVCIPILVVTFLNLWSLLSITLNRKHLSLRAISSHTVHGHVGISVFYLLNYLVTYDVKVAAVMLVYIFVMNSIASYWRDTRKNWAWECLVIHLASWAAQFYGHHLEGKRPALVDNF